MGVDERIAKDLRDAGEDGWVLVRRAKLTQLLRVYLGAQTTEALLADLQNPRGEEVQGG